MNRFLNCVLALLVASVATTQASAVRYVFTNIADTTSAAPSGTFGGFEAPSISGNSVAFAGTYGISHKGVFIGGGGPLTTIVKRGDPAPTETFHSLSDPAISGSTIAFRGSYHDPGSGIFTGSGGPLTTIVKRGDPAPSGTFGDFLTSPAISGNTVAFLGSYTGGSGIFTGSGGSLNTIVKTGDPAPINVFSSLSDPAMSGSSTAFVGRYENLNGTTEFGVFVSTAGSLTTIAKTYDVIPEGVLGSIGDLSISGNNVGFIATLVKVPDFQYGVFASDGATVTTIAKTGDTAPSGTFFEFYDSAIGGNTVAFLAEYGELGEGGDRLTATNIGEGIFVGNGGPLTTVINTGDALFGSTLASFLAGPIVSIPKLALDAGGSANIAFVYTLSNGRQGLAVASLVPEPNTVVIFCISLWCFVSSRRAGHGIRLQSGN